MLIGMSRSRMFTWNSEPDEATWFPQKGRVNTVHFRSIYAKHIMLPNMNIGSLNLRILRFPSSMLATANLELQWSLTEFSGKEKILKIL